MFFLQKDHFYMKRTLSCGHSTPVDMIEETPAGSWADQHCALISDDLYYTELDNIKIDRCKNDEKECAELPDGKLGVLFPPTILPNPTFCYQLTKKF